jgi:hypothetical protein
MMARSRGDSYARKEWQGAKKLVLEFKTYPFISSCIWVIVVEDMRDPGISMLNSIDPKRKGEAEDFANGVSANVFFVVPPNQ